MRDVGEVEDEMYCGQLQGGEIRVSKLLTLERFGHDSPRRQDNGRGSEARN